jgi:hypothetical protein
MLTDGKVETVRAVVLSGLRVDRDYSIDGDMMLVPFDKLVDFDAVHLVNYIHNMDRGRGELHPKSALIRCGKNVFSAELTEFEKQKLVQDAFEESLFGAVLCLVCSYGAPAPFGVWSLIAYSAPFSGHIDRGHSYQSEIKRPDVEDELGALEIASAIDLFEKLKKLPKWLGSKIEISLHRLRQSLNTREEVQSVVDLGVSLEAILVKDSNSFGKAKHVKFMGALLVSDDYKVRLNAFDLLNSVYDLRSQAVHSGCFSGKTKAVGGESLSASDLIKNGQTLVKSAIRKVIEQGGYPDAEFKKCFDADKILEH